MERLIQRHKLISVSIGLMFLLVISLANTLAMPVMNQGAFNVAFNMGEETFDVSLLNLERDSEPQRTVSGAGFALFDAQACEFDTEEYICEQIIMDNEALFFTNSDGLIVWTLPAGSYFIEGHSIPNGFAPCIDGSGNPIVRRYFVIRENVQTGALELVVDDVIVDSGIITVFNQRLSDDLIVEKRVVGEDGDELTPEQLEPLPVQEFEFRIIFRHDDVYLDDEFTYVVYEGGAQVDGNVHTITSGGSLFLRHNQQAVFREIPVGVEYRVIEVVPDGFNAVGINAQGVITDGEPSYVLFTNRYEEDVDERDSRYGSLLVGKEVRGVGADTQREFRFVVVIGDERYDFTLRHGESRRFDDIPVGTLYTVYEYDYSKSGYWVNIITRVGYMTERDVEVWLINRFVNQESPKEDKGTGDLEIGKTVITSEDEEIDAAKLFDFTLRLRDLPTEEIEIIVNGETYVIAESTYTFSFQLRHDEVYRILDLPHGVSYEVIEHATPGFIQEITHELGMIFEYELVRVQFYSEMILEEKESIELESTSIRICKELENEDKNSLSEMMFNFVLNIDGAYYTSFELGIGGCYVIDELVVGSEFEVLEVDTPKRYTLVSSGQSTGTLTEEETTVTFVNRDTLRDIPVEKHWEANGQTTSLPDYVTVQLLDGTTLVDVANMLSDEEGNWTHNFTVPRYRDGVEIQYRVIVVPVPGWRDTVTEMNGGFVIINTMIASVDIELEVLKQIIGDTPEVEREFVLRGIGSVPMPEVDRITIVGAGTKSFEAITFTEAGIFEYIIQEVLPTDTGNYIYDTTVNRVIIVVSKVNGEFAIEKTILREDVEIAEIIFIYHYRKVEDEYLRLLVAVEENKRIEPQLLVSPQPPIELQPLIQNGLPQIGDDNLLEVWIILSVVSGTSLMLYAFRRVIKRKLNNQ